MTAYFKAHTTMYTTANMFDIRESTGRGLGLFASQRILQDTVISSEAPLFALEQPTAIRIWRAFIRLPTDLKQDYMSLTIRENADRRLEDQDIFARKQPRKSKPRANASEPSKLEQYATAITNFKAGRDGLNNLAVEEAGKVVAIFHNNAYTLRNENDTRLMFGLFMQEARMNHSCLPNTVCAWNQELGKRTVRAVRDIEAGEEITKAYVDSHGDREARMQCLLYRYGFTCTCVACRGESLVQGQVYS